MVIHNFNFNGSFFLPNKADMPLIVDSYSVLTFPVSLKLLKSVPWGNTQALQRNRCIQDFKLDSGCSVDTPEFPDIKISKQLLSIFAFKRFYHTNYI
jgi:hypothetical protein